MSWTLRNAYLKVATTAINLFGPSICCNVDRLCGKEKDNFSNFLVFKINQGKQGKIGIKY